MDPAVFIVDDEPAVRESLEALLESVGLSVETFAMPRDFLSRHDQSRPGCLILDVRMPQMSGLKLHRKLRDEGSEIPVIFLTGHADVATAVEVMRNGAFDLLEKPFNEQHLLDRVQAALARDRQNRRQRAGRQAAAARLESLSPRERQIVEHVIEGRTSKAIACRLGIGVKTVDSHRADIMRKLGVETVAELVLLLVRGGYHRDRRRGA